MKIFSSKKNIAVQIDLFRQRWRVQVPDSDKDAAFDLAVPYFLDLKSSACLISLMTSSSFELRELLTYKRFRLINGRQNEVRGHQKQLCLLLCPFDFVLCRQEDFNNGVHNVSAGHKT